MVCFYSNDTIDDTIAALFRVRRKLGPTPRPRTLFIGVHLAHYIWFGNRDVSRHMPGAMAGKHAKTKREAAAGAAFPPPLPVGRPGGEWEWALREEKRAEAVRARLEVSFPPIPLVDCGGKCGPPNYPQPPREQWADHQSGPRLRSLITRKVSAQRNSGHCGKTLGTAPVGSHAAAKRKGCIACRSARL